MKTPACPVCKKALSEGAASIGDGPFPFCSPRCKLVDLGAWLDGSYRIPGEPIAIDPDDEESMEALRRLTEGDAPDA